MVSKEELKNSILKYYKATYGKPLSEPKAYEIFNALSKALVEQIADDWHTTKNLQLQTKKAYYLSAEYLMGRALGNNLINMGIHEEVKEVLEELNINLNQVEEIEEDAGLGNGGLGRLAACFMDSGATMNLPLQGYGIRYSNGLFNQRLTEDGAQTEEIDTWLKYGDPWSIRREDEAVIIDFQDFSVKAVPYDMPIIGYGTKNINTLRLWQSEPLMAFDFEAFNAQEYGKAVKMKNKAEDISRILYPNDSKTQGKLLRLRQQYFMVSASLKDIIRNYKVSHGSDFKDFTSFHVVQLNDTHPVLAIPELIRLLVDEENMSFEEAVAISQSVFAYTNHTILAEALEKWDVKLIHKLFPRILEIIRAIDKRLMRELKAKRYVEEQVNEFRIIQNKQVYMAHLAIYISFAVNGVAQLHTDILKAKELGNWYELYSDKFQNKTNGITPRRWLKFCNQELAGYITELLGSENWASDLNQLKGLERFADDEGILSRLKEIKNIKKQQLAAYIKEKEGIEIDPNSLFDIQIKRLHEYKRQLLNAFYILDLYYRLKENPDLDMPKITFIFGAKAFPGYMRAKAIVRYIGQVAKLVNNDKTIGDKIKVVFVENYNVSYGEKLFPAADVSKQVSTAGKEASGTGNMKFMLNGALTFGTYDGANVEIVKEAGEGNNFIFGLRVEDIEKISASYEPKEYYKEDPDLKRVVDSLVDGTFDDKDTGEFEDLYKSLLKEGDTYFLLADFKAFKETQDKVFESYKNQKEWAKKSLMNIANAGIFSSDRTIMQYAEEIWHIQKK